MAFTLEVVNVFRDFSQGLYGNRIPFDDEDVLEILKIWNELVKESLENPNAKIKFGPFEIGGADPQVTAEFRNKNFMETYRLLRKHGLYTALRPLFRAANTFLLEPVNEKDLEFIVNQLAEDVADGKVSPDLVEELLRMKIFDSQGITKEVESAVMAVAELHKKYKITAEIAIPYSKGEHYPDEMYIKKVEEAFELLARSGMPLNKCRISLKDMGGQLDPSAAKTLLPKIINKLKELQKKRKEETGKDEIIPIGLHLHDTGFGKASYLEAIRICNHKDIDYPLVIDTVECDPYKPEYVGAESYRNTGFTSFLDINEGCEKEGIHLGLTEGQKEKLKKMAAIGKRVSDRFSVRRVEALFNGEELRQFDIPGGAFASFSTAVAGMIHDKKIGLAKLLDLNQRDALLVAGHALNAVGRLMGYPFAVTPGFQNKQIAALNVLKNMIKGKVISPGMKVEEIKAILEKEFTDANVENYFLAGLKPAVQKFLQGEMPVETLKRLGIPTNATVHPRIRKQFQIREQVLTKVTPSRLKAAQDIVETLYKEDLVHPTQLQREMVEKRYPDPEFSQEDREKILIDKAKKTHVIWALELGDPKKLRQALERRWWHEPNPADYQGDKQGYQWALAKFQKGKNPLPDELEKNYLLVKQGKLSFETLNKYKKAHQEKERIDIRLSALNCITDNLDLWSGARSGNPDDFNRMFEVLYSAQEKMIYDKERLGEYFVFSQKRRLDIAVDYFTQMAVDSCSNKSINFYTLAKTKRKEIEGRSIKAPMSGQVMGVHVKVGDYVKAGDLVATFYAMKTEMELRAGKDGYVGEILVEEGGLIDGGKPLMIYREEAKPEILRLNDRRSRERWSNLRGNVTPIAEKIMELKLENADAVEDLENIKKEVDQEVARYRPKRQNSNDLMVNLQKRGFYGKPLTLTERTKQSHKNEIHVIGNRAGCAVKLYADLKQANCQVKLLHTKGDEYSTLIRNAESGEAVLVDSYTSYQIVLDALIKIARENPGKEICYHPGWGLLSEDYRFVGLLEKEVKRLGLNIRFVGPASEPMREVGGKKTFRDIVQKTAPDYNPRYFGNTYYSSDTLKNYIDGGFNDPYRLNEICRAEFKEIQNMGGNVVIKAIDGGGGYGIKFFKIDPNKTDEENYRIYIDLLQNNVAYSEKTFNNGQMLTEECIEGETRHLEIQFAACQTGSVLLNVRDCTAQNTNQKTNETNNTLGDYPPHVIANMLKAAKEVTNSLGKEKHYKGVGTLEMLILPDGTIKFLEVNTRVQVEHMVTEEDIRLKTGKNISLPLVNLAFSQAKDGETPHQLLKRDFDLTDGDLMKAVMLSEQRVEHVRLNSLEVDFLTGKAVPSFFWGYMWPSSDIIAAIAKETGANIIISDIGDGNYNAQTGAVCGTTEQVLKATQKIQELVELARTCLHNDGTLSTRFVLEMHKLLYDKTGKFNLNFSTKTQDEFLKAIDSGEIELEFDMQSLSETPALKEGAIEKAYDQFMRNRHGNDYGNDKKRKVDVAFANNNNFSNHANGNGSSHRRKVKVDYSYLRGGKANKGSTLEGDEKKKLKIAVD